MQAVLLRGGLTRLTEQTEQREVFAAALSAGLESVGGALRAARRDPRVTRQAYYAMTLHFEAHRAGGLTRAQYLQALAAEGMHLGLPYPPVYRHPILNLYHPTSPVPYRDPALTQDYASLHLPVTERVVTEEGVVLMHPLMLGGAAYVEQLLTAVRKVQENLPSLKAHFAGG